MNKFKLGDLVGLNVPTKTYPIKTGIIVSTQDCDFTVKWTSYDKVFFMEKDDFIFKELNKLHLLSSQTFKSNTGHINLVLLNPS